MHNSCHRIKHDIALDPTNYFRLWIDNIYGVPLPTDAQQVQNTPIAAPPRSQVRVRRTDGANYPHLENASPHCQAAGTEQSFSWLILYL